MTASTNASKSVTALSPPLALKLSPVARRTVLAYHELSLTPTDYSYALSCQQFAEHLLLTSKLHHHPGENRPLLTISFDDGHISHYTHALPLLEKHSCKAIFFVIVGRIGERKNFMSWRQLREIVSLGHGVETHSWSHKFLTECSNSELDEELKRSRETLEDRLGICIDAVSAPHGLWNRRVLKACVRAGYRRLYTSDPWSQSRASEAVEVIGRLVMVQSMDTGRLLDWLTMGRTAAGVYRVRYALKQSARRVLGNKLYYRLWTRFSGWTGPEDNRL